MEGRIHCLQPNPRFKGVSILFQVTLLTGLEVPKKAKQ